MLNTLSNVNKNGRILKPPRPNNVLRSRMENDHGEVIVVVIPCLSLTDSDLGIPTVVSMAFGKASCTSDNAG